MNAIKEKIKTNVFQEDKEDKEDKEVKEIQEDKEVKGDKDK